MPKVRMSFLNITTFTRGFFIGIALNMVIRPKLSASLICAMMLICLASNAASAQYFSQVLSQNAVGYVAVTVPRGGFVMAALPFDSLSGSLRNAEQLIGSQLPTGSFVYMWDADEQRYVGDNRGFGGWSTTLLFERGDAFWLYVPTTAPEEEYVVYLMGEVPADAFTTTCVEKGLNLTSYPYPAEQVWSETAFAATASLGDMMALWNGSSYILNNKSFSGWSDPDMIVPVGQGFWFISKTETRCFEESKPYTWP